MSTLHTFLFTDIENSTSHWENSPEAMQIALARHDEIIKTIILQNEGEVVKNIGDGFHTVFSSAPKAAQAALEIQLALKTESWPQQIGEIKVRIGFHTGESEQRDNDYFGQTLNRAARIMDTGHGGQIVLSSTSSHLITNNLPAKTTIRSLGQHRLKGIPEPEEIIQLSHPDIETNFPPLRSLTILKHNLPVQLTSFIGREKEIENIKTLLQDTHLLTLLGPGGTGKSRLQIQIAEEVIQKFKDGVWLVELAPIADPTMIPTQIAAALKIQEQPNREIITSVTDYLRHRQTLLLLDNVEHLVRESAQIVEHLLKNCPDLKILVTGREALFIGGETTIQIPSLSLPSNNGKSEFQAICEAESVQLFVSRAQTVRPDFAINPQNSGSIAEIVTRLDGIPLALELAAARLRMMNVEQIAERLNDRFRLLTGGSRTAMPRQQTLQALIDWSWQLLDDPEKVLLRRLSVFSGGWTMESAQAVCTDELIDEFGVFDYLEQLVNKSLVLVDHNDKGDTRYRMLESIRQFSRDHLLAAEESETLRNRHAAYFMELAKIFKAKFMTAEYLPYLTRTKAELDNYRSVLTWSLEEKPEITLEIVATLLIHNAYLISPQEAFTWASAVVEKTRPLYENNDPRITPVNFGRALGVLGVSFAGQGLNAQGIPPTKEAISILAQTDNKEDWAHLVFWLFGQNLFAQTISDDLIQQMEVAIDACRGNGFNYVLSTGLGMYGFYKFNHQDPVTGGALLQEAYQTMDQVNHPRQIGDKYNAQAMIAFRMGDHEKALAKYQKAIEQFDSLNDTTSKTRAVSGLGHAYRGMSQIAAAAEQYQKTIVLFEESGQYPAVAHQLECFAYLSIAQSQYPHAARLLGAAQKIRETTEAPITRDDELNDYETALNTLKKELEPTEFDQYIAAGGHLETHDAVLLAINQPYE